MKYYRLFLYLSLIVIGIIIGIAIRHYYDLPIADTINIVDLATLVATVFLAVYIPDVLDRKLQVRRDKKELIEVRLVQLQALFRKINLIVQGEKEIAQRDFLIVKNTLDIIQSKLDTIGRLLSYANLPVSFADDMKNITDLTAKHKELLYSDQMESAGFSYSLDTIQHEEILNNKIDESTSLLIFRLSEA